MDAIPILMIFFIFAVLMITKKLPTIISLPFMALSIALIAGENWNYIITTVISKGALKLYNPIIATIFGGIFARIISKTGIAEDIIKSTAELIGDHPIPMALGLTLAVAVIFSSLGGMGAVIMTGSVVLPLMLSVGIKPMTTAGLFLMGISLGGLFNPTGFTFYQSTLGIPLNDVKNHTLLIGGLLFLTTIVFTLINVRTDRVAWAMPDPSKVKKVKKELSIFALITPLVPIAITFSFKTDVVVAALIIGCVYAAAVTQFRKMPRLLSSSMIEGVHDVAGALILTVGIGMLLEAVTCPAVTAKLQPLIKSAMPSTPMGFIIFFTLLSPLALYRGPLNMWGMGSGLANLMIASGKLPAFFIMAALRTVGCIQGICDPTNTQNVWTADYLKEDTVGILRKTILYIVVMVFAALFLATTIYWK